MQGVVVVTPPAGKLVELTLAKEYLRVDYSDHDVLIATHIAAAGAWLDGPTGWLGWALEPQTLRHERRGFGQNGSFDLPLGPASEVLEITYDGPNGDPLVVDESIYELDGDRVRLARQQAWPSGCAARVLTTYRAGFPDNALPPQIRTAVLMHIKILYSDLDDKQVEALERSRDALLAPIHRWRV